MSEQLTNVIESRTQRFLILLILALSTALPTINLTVANAVLPQMQGDLSASLEEISWVLTAALVCTAIGVPASSWFSLRFGRRRSLLVALAIFTFASAMFGAATTLEEVILWRALQGLFGGPIPALCMASLLDIFPKKSHAMALSVWSGGVMLGPILGPPLGGVMAEIYNWKLAFMFLAPFGVLSILLVVSSLPESRKFPDLRLDWLGFTSLCIGVAAIQIMLDRGNRLDWFESAEIMTWAVIAGFSIYLFSVHSITTQQPFIDLRIFLDRNYVIGCSCMAISGILTFVPLMLLPNFLAQLRGLPVEIVSLMLVPRALGYALGIFVLGRLIRVMDGRVMLALGFAIQAYGFWYLTNFDLSVGPTEVFLGGTILGLGEGVMWTPLASITFLTLSPTLRSYGVPIFQFGRFFASGLGISVAVVLLTRSTQQNRAGLGEKISPFNEQLQFPILLPTWDPTSLQGLIRIESELFRQATMIGYLNDFWALFLLTLTVLPLIMLLDKPNRLG
jgi:DHA2 family multidrug resistance protein